MYLFFNQATPLNPAPGEIYQRAEPPTLSQAVRWGMGGGGGGGGGGNIRDIFLRPRCMPKPSVSGGCKGEQMHRSASFGFNSDECSDRWLRSFVESDLHPLKNQNNAGSGCSPWSLVCGLFKLSGVSTDRTDASLYQM